MSTLRIGIVQYELAPLQTEADFWDGIRQDVEQAKADQVRLLIYPEYLTAHLLALSSPLAHDQAAPYIDGFTERYIRFFSDLSRDSGIIILAGTHIHREGNGYVNEAYLFFPDGRIETQQKLHLTPEERNCWHLTPGNRLNVIDTEFGRMAILICYDIEFPELSRIVAQQDVVLILNPTYTDQAAGYYRVRYCAQARAIENQRFVALSGMVGMLPYIPQIDAGYAESGCFSPCDYPFPPNGILNIAPDAQKTVVIADLNLSELKRNWAQGQVSPYKDRKPELYQQLAKQVPNPSR
jgi:predicted amidohydrolase